DIYVTVPQNLDVASNGIFKGLTNNGDGTETHHWQVKNPIATYLITLDISDYRIFSHKYVGLSGDTMDVVYYVYHEDYPKASTDFKRTVSMIEILASYYGEYPFFNEKYGIAEYSGEWGGMEYQTLTCLSSSYIPGNHSADQVLVHELAHQWWGDCVTPKTFHHSWVSEGFATYSEALYFGHLKGLAEYHRYMNEDNNALRYTDTIYRYDISTPRSVYPGVVYYKGAWVLHTLRHIVGDSTFFNILRQYRAQFAYASATTEDFQAVCEAVSQKDLDWFFHQWIYEPGHPRYFYGWSSEEISPGTHRIIGFIDQTQTLGPIFQMPLDITIQTTSGDTTVTLLVDEQSEFLDLTVRGQPTAVILDKDNWVLKEVSTTTSPILKYKGHFIDDSQGNHNGRPDPNETVNLIVTLTNSGINAAGVVATLRTDDPDISLITDTVPFSNIAHGGSAANQGHPFSFSVRPEAEGHVAIFKIEIQALGEYTALDSFGVGIGEPKILLVDDDGGKTYETYYTSLLNKSFLYAAHWDVADKGSPADTLSHYQTVIWFTGDDRDSTLSPEDQAYLASFLDHGGRLLISGQNIGYDLVEAGIPADSMFYANYLHAQYLSDNSGETQIRGVIGDPITHGLVVYLEGPYGGAGNQNSPDVLAPLPPAATILQYYPSRKGAALRYEDPVTNSRLVYLAFGLEGIAGPLEDSAGRLMKNIMTWLSGTTTVEDEIKGGVLPTTFSLSQNYPNPFFVTGESLSSRYPQTKIHYQLSRAEKVVLKIYDILGREVRTLVNEKKAAGYFEVSWDGCDDQGQPMAAGIYFCKLKAGDFVQIRKIVILR
ncbi:MAG: M1 family aminopeptidase, partial [candidate division KSB1 bacterium]|nr:M1 family aminopeptidase [candidate division KSB1 bacterium]